MSHPHASIPQGAFYGMSRDMAPPGQPTYGDPAQGMAAYGQGIPGMAQGQMPQAQGYPMPPTGYAPMPHPAYYGQPVQPMAYPQGYAPMPGYNAATAPSMASTLTSNRFLKGLIIGGAAAYLLTNDQVQQSAIKGMVKVWTLLQGGVAELKERFHDAEAEVRANGVHHDDA